MNTYSEVGFELDRLVRRDIGRDCKNSMGHHEYEELVTAMCEQLARDLYDLVKSR